MKKYKDKDVKRFLAESNAIEKVYTEDALIDSVLAWKYINLLKWLELEDVLTVHGLILKNLEPRIAGKIRNYNVYVAGRMGAPVRRLEYLLTHWLKDANIVKTAKEIKKSHVVFEHIHPFEDGNGRIGRMILNWQRQKAGLPILIIKENDRFQYYQWF